MNKVLNVVMCAVISLVTVFLANKIYHLEPLKKEYHDMPREMSKHVRRFQAVDYDNKTYGTGFNIKFQGKNFVITNAHVCKVSDMLKTKGTAIVNGNKLKIIKVWDKHDLCALESDREEGLELAYQDSSPLDKVTLIGHPRGLDLTVREGRIISEDFIIVMLKNGLPTMFVSDTVSTTAYGGNSGSPILNRWGRVVGVLFAGQDAYPHEPSIVPYEFLKEFLEELMEEK